LSTISAAWQHADLSGSYLQDLAGKAEEVMDLLGTYFPILYTQPPNMPGCVTRAELATAVEQALAAVPVFAPHVIPLLLEKLSSSIRWGLQAFQWFIRSQGHCMASHLSTGVLMKKCDFALLDRISILQGCAAP
jgi:hypothetical protein